MSSSSSGSKQLLMPVGRSSRQLSFVRISPSRSPATRAMRLELLDTQRVSSIIYQRWRREWPAEPIPWHRTDFGRSLLRFSKVPSTNAEASIFNSWSAGVCADHCMRRDLTTRSSGVAARRKSGVRGDSVCSVSNSHRVLVTNCASDVLGRHVACASPNLPVASVLGVSDGDGHDRCDYRKRPLGYLG